MKRAVVEALLAGDFQHFSRRDIDVKNLLAMGAVSPSFVEEVVISSRGMDYVCSPLHGNRRIDCHLIKSRGWYIKFFFLDPDTVFISVHQ